MSAAVQQGRLPCPSAIGRTATLTTLAKAAEHWAKADGLADDLDQTEEALGALVKVAERIVREAAATPAETIEALRCKAQILERIEGPAFRDEASLTYAGQILLLSLLEDLTREGDAA